LGGIRTLLIVPMLKDDEIIGAFGIFRQEVKPFTDKQIELVQNFAAQAVIAIENTRLLNELKQRTTDLTESLRQQTATSDVLEVISSSQGDLGPVFQKVLGNAKAVCDAKFGELLLTTGDGSFRSVALDGVPEALVEARKASGPLFQPDPGLPLYRAAETKQVVHIADMTTERGYRERFLPFTVLADAGGARTILLVPMVKDDKLIGVISIYRQKVRPFGEKQIELAKNFAAQAVIAIENARLLNELRQRTDDLSEALEQQTASSEVLQVISS
jgi:GAF domain-containing protein